MPYLGNSSKGGIRTQAHSIASQVFYRAPHFKSKMFGNKQDAIRAITAVLCNDYIKQNKNY